MKKFIYAASGSYFNREFPFVHGPDVLNFIEFCTLKGYIFDSKGQIDMSSPYGFAVFCAFRDKVYFWCGGTSLLLTDLQTNEAAGKKINAMLTYIRAYLSPTKDGRDLWSKDLPAAKEYLESAGIDSVLLEGWDEIELPPEMSEAA